MTSLLLALAPLANAGDVSGHVGVVVPLASINSQGEVGTVADGFTYGVPVGIGKALTERVVVDFEFVPLHSIGGGNELLIHPGVVFKLGGGFGTGVRAAFEVASGASGFTWIVNRGFRVGDQAVFVEGVVPVRTVALEDGRTSSVGFALHTGVGF